MCRSDHIDNGVKDCNIKAVREEKLKNAFVKSINKIINNKENFIKKLMRNINMVLESQEYEAEVKDINEKLEQLKKQMMNLVRLNIRSSLDSQIYDEEY